MQNCFRRRQNASQPSRIGRAWASVWISIKCQRHFVYEHTGVPTSNCSSNCFGSKHSDCGARVSCKKHIGSCTSISIDNKQKLKCKMGSREDMVQCYMRSNVVDDLVLFSVIHLSPILIYQRTIELFAFGSLDLVTHALSLHKPDDNSR